MVKGEKGFSLLEVIIAGLILGLVILGASTFQTGMYKNVRLNKDKAFATQKAIQMFEELRAFVQSNRENALNNLANFDDGNTFKHVLTTESKVTNPADPLSENVNENGKWKYVRQIRVMSAGKDQNARRVIVTIYYADKQNNNVRASGIGSLAEVAGILKTNIGPVPPTQVYDVFLLTIQNTPGWWVDLDILKPIFDFALNDLESRNPGLEFRRHYITQSGFGRDPYYSPYINTNADTASADINWVYFYPGKITPTNTSPAKNYYVDTNINARKRNDDGLYFTQARDDNFHRKYSLADQFNHVVRYPEELAAYNRIKTQNPNPEPNLEPTLTMLLEDLNSNPNKYKNIIIINLHGELFPFPPVRNYSDAAREPIIYPNIRVVTHPENLQYPNNTDINLRVYAYQTTPISSSTTLGNNVDVPAISLYLPTEGLFGGPVLTPTINAVSNIQKIIGSSTNKYVKVTASSTNYSKTTLTANKSIGETSITVSDITGINVGDQLEINGQSTVYTVVPPVPSGNNVNINPGLTAPVSTGNIVRKRPISGVTLNSNANIGDTSISVAKTGGSGIGIGDVINVDGEIVSVTGGDGATFPTTLTIYPPLTRAHNSGEPVTMMPDYSVDVSPKTIWAGESPKDGILITLYGTPTRCPLHSPTNTGLPDSRRLYKMEYIPCPITNNFNTDLTDSNSNNAKNTARWIVTISGTAGFNDQRMDIETRIGTNLQDGISFDQDIHQSDTSSGYNLRPNLKNVSRTFVWIGGAPIPEVEKYQFLGDPRWEPYLDAKTTHRYNWFFYRRSSDNSADLTNDGPNYANFDRHVGTKWDNSASNVGNVDADVARSYYMLREGLMTSYGIFNSITGFTSYYYGLGGEIGGDSSNTLYNIRKQPWYNTSTPGYENVQSESSRLNEIIGGQSLIQDTNNNWYCKPWLGDLYPDELHNFWINNGNLPTLTPASTLTPPITQRFYRVRFNSAIPGLSNRKKRLNKWGSSTFLNGNADGSTSNTFNHYYDNGAYSNLTKNSGEPGKGLSDAFNLAVPDTVSASRPFKLNHSSGWVGPEWNKVEYSSIRNTLRFITSTGVEGNSPVTSGSNANIYFYKSDDTSKVGSSIVKLKRTSENKVGYMLINGLDKQISGEVGAAWIARYSQAGVLQTFMNTGDLGIPGNDVGRTVQLPRVVITHPSESTILENPSSTDVTWNISWKRWDNKKYTEGYPDNWYDETQIVYNLKYSSDNAKTWKFVSDNSDAKVGEYDPTHSVFGTPKTVTGGVTTETYSWGIGSFAAGNYIVRIEAYRNNMLNTGYSYHQVLVTVQR